MDRDRAGDAEGETASLASGSRIRPAPGVLAKRVDDEIVLVNMETNRIYELNRTAASLWDLLGGGATSAELSERMAAEFDIEQEQLSSEIDEVLRQLAMERLIRSE